MAIKTIPQFKIVKEAGVKYANDIVIAGPEGSAKLISTLIGQYDREHAVVLYLNQRHKVMGYEIASVGTINQCFMQPREIFRGALMQGAAAIIVGHNHPSGDPKPSHDDIVVTENILKAGSILGVRVLDHIVVGDDDRFASIREQNPHIWIGNQFHL